MNNITTWLAIGLIVIVGAFGLYKVTSAPVSDVPADSSGAAGTVEEGTDSSFNDTPDTPINTSPGEKTYSMSEVSSHASAESCWSVIRGEVYDLTNWKGSHPGGERAIMGLCGKDGTSSFEGRHGGSERPEDTLLSFKIGVLAQ